MKSKIQTTADKIASLATSYIVNLSLQQGKDVTVSALNTLKKNILKDIRNGELESAPAELRETRMLLIFMEEHKKKAKEYVPVIEPEEVQTEKPGSDYREHPRI